MKIGTYKLVRIKNHYHILGEKCEHTGRPRQSRKSAFSRVKTSNPSKSINLAYSVLFGLVFGVLTIII